MIKLEDATIFNEVLNYYKNVSIESKKQLKDSLFTEDEDDYLNEDYFESL